MKPTDFFQLHLGSKIGQEPEASVKSMRLPQRAKSGIQMMNLGQTDDYYIVSASSPSQVIGRVDLPSRPEINFVAAEGVDPKKHIAQWLIETAVTPFMVGVIKKAHPEPSFEISKSLNQVYFCDSSGGFVVDIELVRSAQQIISGLDWKKIVAPAILAYSRFKQSEQGENLKERTELYKLFDMSPGLDLILPRLGILPRSGEYTILSWLNRGS
jgi:hypothetical protein